MNSNEENKTPRFCRGGFHRLFFVPIILLVILVKSALVLVLWNELIPDLFHGPSVTYLQAIGLTVLANLLVGFGRGGPPWRHRWHSMSQEDRDKIRETIRERCGTLKT